MASKSTFGLGTGAVVKTTGVTLLLPRPSAGFLITNTSVTNPIYVVANALAVDNAGAVLAASGDQIGVVSDVAQTGVRNLDRLNAAAIISRGFRIAAGGSQEFTGWSPTHGGPQLLCFAIASTGGAVTITGGETSVAE